MATDTPISNLIINELTSSEYEEATKNDELYVETDRAGIFFGSNGVELPPGLISLFGGTTAPNGWLMCDGSAVSRTTYAALFDVLGTSYGAGDGSTTFNLPNFSDKVPQGNSRGYITAGLPEISGTFPTTDNDGGAGVSGAFKRTSTVVSGAEGGGTDRVMDFKASRSSSIYGGSTTVQPPACLCYFIIKY